MKRLELRAARAAWMLAAALVTGCEMPLLAGGSNSTETGKKVHLTGRVSAGNGQGLSGVTVSLAGTALHDTTDADGVYLLSGRVAREAEPPADTLRFALQGQALGLRVVTSLQETVPSLQVVQRGFLGYLKTGGLTVARIEGVLKGHGIPAGDSAVGTFFHNTQAGNYSGFLYFPAPGDSVRAYEVRVRVFGANGELLGASPSVPFTSQAGNILIPEIEL
jgi:hypothetical protein